MNNTQGNGTEGTRQAITTIKVEKVTDFERLVKTGTGWRSDDPSHESKMKVGIRVGNQVAQVELRYEVDWNNSDRNLRSQRIVKVYGANELTNTLDAIGISLDWTDVFAQYEPLAKVWQDEREKARRLACAKAYDESWAHKFVREARQLAQTLAMGSATFVVTPERDKYIDGKESFSRDIRVMMTYKGKSENVWMENGALKMYNAGFRQYRAKKVATMLTNFRELVDTQLARTERERQARATRQTNLQTLNERFPEFRIIQPYSDGAFVAQLSAVNEFSGRVNVGYSTNEQRTAESFRIEGIAMALNATEFKAIMDTLKAAQQRSDDRDAERRAARNAQ